MIKCRVAAEHDHGSDHLPIETLLTINAEKPIPEPTFNYAKTNWEDFSSKLIKELSRPALQTRTLQTRASIDSFAEQLVDALIKAVEETTPLTKPSPHSKRWWSKELIQTRRKANRLRNIHKLTGHPDDERAWREKQLEYTKGIEKTKNTKWREYVESADNKSIWQIKRYVMNCQAPTRIPTLDGCATTNEEKTKAFQKTFFPPPPPADLSDLKHSGQVNYPSPVLFEPYITIQQIRRAVEKPAPNKAPGPDKVSNRVLQHALPNIERHLQLLMQASLDLGHFPRPFKETRTVVLRKPGKPDYTKSKAYRPIALENTIGKVLESVIADIMSYLTETYELLPEQHYGGRPGRSTEDALMVLSENIYKAWKNGKVFTALFLDVAGAFNNVHHRRLIHNLKARRMPHLIAQWIQSFLCGRSTRLQFNGATSNLISTPAGVPQGSPLSPLLYMYYNADLLDVVGGRDNTLSLGFIDDIVYSAEGHSDVGNVRKLRDILLEAEDWRRRHGAQFETSKYVLVHFTRNYKRPTKAVITINGHTVNPSTEARYLGVILDQQLRFKSHLQQAVKKGTNAALALSSIAKCSWGAPYEHVRQLFQSVLAPRTDYAAVVWHRPRADGATAATTQVRKLTTVQRIAMKAVLDCYRTTLTAAMEIEADLQPTWLRLQSKVLLSTARMQSLSLRHPIHKWLQNALRTRTAQGCQF